MSVRLIYRKKCNKKLDKRANQSNIPKAQTVYYKFMNFLNSNGKRTLRSYVIFLSIEGSKTRPFEPCASNIPEKIIKMD